jgi:hypothetical protein
MCDDLKDLGLLPIDEVTDTSNEEEEEDEEEESKDLVPESEGGKSLIQIQEEDLRNDYAYARKNIRVLLKKSKRALNGSIRTATESGSPRAWEVVGHLIKVCSDLNEKLILLQQATNNSKIVKEKSQNAENITNTQNNYIIKGTTADLQQLIRETQELGDNDADI